MVRPDIDIHKSANANALLRTNTDKKWVMIDPNSSHYPNKHSHIVATDVFVEETPLLHWTAPTTSIKGDTALVRFTDGVIGAYTYTTVWALQYTFLVPNYYIWCGSLTQIGTSNPLSSHKNTSDFNTFNITWVRSSEGLYEGTLSMEFDMNKIPSQVIPMQNGNYAYLTPVYDNIVYLTTYAHTEGHYDVSDDLLSNTYFELKIYL